MRTSLAAWSSVLLATAAPFAQNRPPDLSGRWQLVEPTRAERALDTLDISSVDQILVTQTPSGFAVTHLSGAGTHPEAGSFEYGSGGIVGDRIPPNTTWGVTHIGTQIMISRSTTWPADEHRIRITTARGSMWRLEAPDRLVIEFGEERTGERPKTATRRYVKQTP